MYNFGSTDNHGNNVEYDDNPTWDNPGTLTIACWIRLLAGSGARYLLGKRLGLTAGQPGWMLGMGANEIVSFITDDSAIEEVDVGNTAYTVDGVTHSTLVTWDLSNANFWRDGVADGTPAHTRNIVLNAQPVAIGCTPAGATGPPVQVGQVALWSDVLSDANIQRYHFGAEDELPSQGTLLFWDKGIAALGYEEVTDIAATTITGTVTLTSDPVDNYYEGGSQGFTFCLDSWLPPLIASGLFGGYLLSEKTADIWKAIQKVKGTTVIGVYKREVDHLLHGLATWRKPRVFMGMPDGFASR